ncbi:MAG TPA: S53 family peptidase [Gemmataceae bacterium]|jgi:subtilase family serine protease
MFDALWRSLRRTKRASTPRKPHSSVTDRTVLSVESLESRDLLSGFFSPSFILEAQFGSASPFATTSPTGYGPGLVRQAYGFNNIGLANGTILGDGSGQTIAIVDAYSQPNIGSDLHAFDSAFGLPDPPRFRVVNENGGSSLPVGNGSWGMEESLDVQWAHAMAPGANIVLVEANTASETDLLSAVQWAANQPGVSVVSMSWGGGEYSNESYYDSVFRTPAGHQGVAFIASSGDSGAPASYPAVSPNVLAVGGTSLYTNGSTYGSEAAWTASTGGISAYETQPGYQRGTVSQSTTHRTSPDVSYNANPNTGMSVYDTYGTPAGSPWLQVGGTSAGAPQWAALVAIADQARAMKGLGTLDSGTQLLPMLYQLPNSDFHDVTSGSSTGNPTYAAVPGYDLVTGLGSPYADRIVSALSGQTLSAPPGGGYTGGSGPLALSPSSPSIVVSSSPQSPPPDNPLAQTAKDAFFIAKGWMSHNTALVLMAWQDFVALLHANPAAAGSLEGALFGDLLSYLS